MSSDKGNMGVMNKMVKNRKGGKTKIIRVLSTNAKSIAMYIASIRCLCA